MASKRFALPFMPVRQTCGMVYQDDLDLIKTMGQHRGTILREALHIFCEAWRTGCYLPVMTREERDRYVQEQIPGSIKDRHIELDIPPEVIRVPSTPLYTSDIVKRPVAILMSSWSKDQREAYILEGIVPSG